jgi:NAD(P)-dependent dehydrogenase (short-subunit alcohol dehydrogenase family)
MNSQTSQTKVWLITGSSTGFGRATSETVLAMGYTRLLVLAFMTVRFVEVIR